MDKVDEGSRMTLAINLGSPHAHICKQVYKEMQTIQT